MAKAKIRIAAIFGGNNNDNHRSCKAVADVLPALRSANEFKTSVYGITLEGNWVTFKTPVTLLEALAQQPFELTDAKVAEIDGAELFSTVPESALKEDVVFPVMSGTPGVDGNLQGLFASAGVRVVGSDVLGSSICHDKSTLKLLLRAIEVNTPYHIVIPNKAWMRDPLSQAMRVATIKFPVVIKPARGTNGLGLSHTGTPTELRGAIDVARRFDTRVVAEKYLENVRFLECGVLEDNLRQLYISRIMETKNNSQAKVLNFLERGKEGSFSTSFPEDLSDEIIKKIQEIAEQVFEATKASGFMQIEFALSDENELFVIEANAHPYLGKDGNFSKVWEATGLEYTDFIYSSAYEAIARPLGLD